MSDTKSTVLKSGCPSSIEKLQMFGIVTNRALQSGMTQDQVNAYTVRYVQAEFPPPGTEAEKRAVGGGGAVVLEILTYVITNAPALIQDVTAIAMLFGITL